MWKSKELKKDAKAELGDTLDNGFHYPDGRDLAFQLTNLLKGYTIARVEWLPEEYRLNFITAKSPKAEPVELSIGRKIKE